MGALGRHWVKLVLLGVFVLMCVLIREQKPTPLPAPESLTVPSTSLLTSAPIDPVEPVPEIPFEELSEAEQHKRIDIENMVRIHAALMAFRQETGNFPESLRTLVPDLLAAEHLESPREGEGYNFEFGNTVFRDGRTWEEIKEVQRMEWGDVIPILRSFNHGEDGMIVVNMSYGGIPYETLMNWEWDPNTLDVISKLGWGPGLSEGEFTEVKVADGEGKAVEGAEVWASGRHYSFDLPDRPFLTDSKGVARIPLGVDLDRTKLSLRARTADGRATPSMQFGRGAPPKEVALSLAPTQELSGHLVRGDGEVLSHTWIYFRNDTASTLGAVKTDAKGRWSAQLPEADFPGLQAIPAPPGVVPKHAPGWRLDTAKALKGEGEIFYDANP